MGALTFFSEDKGSFASDLPGKYGMSDLDARHVRFMIEEIGELTGKVADLLAACEEIKRVALEEMGFRSYSVIEQAAIDGVIAAVEKAKH